MVLIPPPACLLLRRQRVAAKAGQVPAVPWGDGCHRTEAASGSAATGCHFHEAQSSFRPRSLSFDASQREGFGGQPQSSRLRKRQHPSAQHPAAHQRKGNGNKKLGIKTIFIRLVGKHRGVSIFLIACNTAYVRDDDER